MNQLIKLFLPMLLSNLVLVLGGVVDMAYLGHFSNDHVAALSVVLSLYTVVYIIGVGILQGVTLKLSEAYGFHHLPRIRQIFMQGVGLMLLSALLGWVLLFLLHDFPKWFGASPQVIDITKDCLGFLALILPAQFLMRLCGVLSQVTENAHKVLLSDSLFFMIKTILSYGLIFGVDVFSIPALGAVGAVLSTLIARWLMLVVYCLFFLEKEYLFSDAALSMQNRTASFASILKIGIPASVMMLIDVIAYCSVALLILPLGSVVSAAHQIVASTGGLMYIIPASIASAYGILVSRYMGSGQIELAEKTARQSMRMIVMISGILSLVLLMGRHTLVSLYSADSTVQSIAISLLLIMCLYTVFDGLLALYSSLLRCWDISILPMVIFAVTMLGLGLGGGWWMAYHGMHFYDFSVSAMGIYGFWSMSAISYALACVLSLLCFHFRQQLKGF